jgi:hypothetical protein
MAREWSEFESKMKMGLPFSKVGLRRDFLLDRGERGPEKKERE